MKCQLNSDSISVLILLGVLVLNVPTVTGSLYAQIATTEAPAIPGSNFSEGAGAPNVTDTNLKADLVVRGLEFPTNMALLGPNDFLVLEKSKGTVERIVNGTMLADPLLQVNVASEVERGMLGIAVSNHSSAGIENSSDTTAHGPYVFLYYTEAASAQDHSPIGNRVYRYELTDNKLVNPKLLLDLPAIPGPRHNGGSITIGADNNLYVTIGDVDGHTTEAQNVHAGGKPDGTGGILRITQDGKPVQSIIGDQSPGNKYYAYGIRNSFGIDFDPLTGYLWDTENGPGSNDEINLVKPGFNSGWLQVQGKAPAGFDDQELVNFGGNGLYRDPEFSWVDTVGPTKVLFFNSDKLGDQYKNDMLVADVHFGRIYDFNLNENRTELVLDGPIADKVAETDVEVKRVIFGSEFGAITDLEVGPDGYLYVLSFGQGAIYRIYPISM